VSELVAKSKEFKFVAKENPWSKHLNSEGATTDFVHDFQALEQIRLWEEYIIEHRIPASLGEAPREICLRIKQTVDEFNKRRMSKESPEAATKRMIQEHEDRLDRSPY